MIDILTDIPIKHFFRKYPSKIPKIGDSPLIDFAALSQCLGYAQGKLIRDYEFGLIY